MLLQAQSPKPGLSAKAKAQIDSVRRAVAEFADPRVAEDSGYEPVFGLIPLQGVHYVRSDLIKGGKFDLTKPPVLMYAPVKGEPQLVGVAYAYQHPRNELWLDITPTCRTWPRISSVRRQRSSTPTRHVASGRADSRSLSRSRRIRLRCSM